MSGPAYDGDGDGDGRAGALPSWATLVRADNPGPMTLSGTNTYVLRAPGAAGAVVVDPGPADERHLAAVAAVAPVRLILLTHGHPDHADGARALHEMTGAPVAAADPRHCVGVEPLVAGPLVAGPLVAGPLVAGPLAAGPLGAGRAGPPGAGRAGPPTAGPLAERAGLAVRVLATPGHTGDSVSLLVTGDEPGLLTGDTILGRGTTVVAHPDGRLAAYLRSLAAIRDLDGPLTLLPGHGPVGGDARHRAADYLAHRAQRLAQVRAALAAGDRTPAQVVRRVYADVDPRLWPAAEQSVQAQLEYLAEPAAGG